MPQFRDPLPVTRPAVAAKREALRLANQLYQNGLADFLRVLDSQRNLYQAEDALLQSQTAVSVDLVALYKALGGGWEAEEQQTAVEKRRGGGGRD